LAANLFDLATREGEPRFEVGFEFTTLTILNQCAWYLAWLEARQSGNTAVEAEALNVMVMIIPNYPTVIPGIPADLHGPDVTDVDREIAMRASLGDPSLVQRFVESNCQNKPWKADA
jgi:hypothetical protein